MSDGPKRHSSSTYHFFAGLLTGVISATLLQPADLLKTRVQQSPNTALLPTIRLILNSSSPFRNLWRGTLPSVLRTGFGSALYFSSLNALRQHLALIYPSLSSPSQSSSALPKLTNTANLATGAIARATAGLILTPLTVLKVRYESSLYQYSSLQAAAIAIFRADGLRGFFAGYGATAARDAPYAGLYVVFYEQLKRRLSASTSGSTGVLSASPLDGPTRPQSMSSTRSAPINFASGILAAALATAITNPFDAVKTRLQLMPGMYGNMAVAGVRMVKDEGIGSLFGGLGLRMGRKALSSALAWTVYEELVKRAEGRWLEGVRV